MYSIDGQMLGLERSLLDHMAQVSLDLTVVDVYDIAASIGKEFEALIDDYGPKAVTNLMPKVIRTLEHLEILTTHHQKENYELDEMKYAISKLQTDKKAKAEERARFEKEIEQVEDAWHQETRELVNVISKLEDENRKLGKTLKDKQGYSSKFQYSGEDDNVLSDIRHLCHDQKEELGQLRKDISIKNYDIEGLQSQLERLTKINADNRKKTIFNAKQVKFLLQERAEAHSNLQEKEQQISLLQNQLAKQGNKETLSPESITDKEMELIENRLSNEGKIIIDLHDPNRPRFSLNELRDILEERNELKSKSQLMEEELKQFKPEESSTCDAIANVKEDTPDSDEGDRPVQGPINREPDCKLFPDKNSDSGIRKFFKFFYFNKKH